jgi:hypothetical protein
LEPDHAPEPAHEVALLDDQVKVALLPLATVVGLAEIETVGAGAGGGDTLTVTADATLPPLPEHVKTYVPVAVSAPVDWEPDSDLEPDHAPEPVHDVALLDDQVKVAPLPLVTVVGLAEIETVGAGAGGADETFTVTADAADPPSPEHVKTYVPVAVSAPVPWEPDSDLEPDQAPEPVQEVALLDDQVKVAPLPLATVVGLAEIETVGAGAGGADDTFTASALVAVPPLPEHVKTYVPVAVSAPVDWEPDSDLDPDHAPDAVHDVAPVLDHVRTDAAPLPTVDGLAENESVGGTGGLAATSTVTAAVAVPPVPVHVSAYVPLVASSPVDWVPDSGLDPDQPSDAVQDVASLDDQISVELLPLATEVGLAEIETVGSGGRGCTSIVIEAVVSPPFPAHVSKKVPVAESAPVDCEPETGLTPDQTPEAVQMAASSADQARSAAPPLATAAGVALRETAGALASPPPQPTRDTARSSPSSSSMPCSHHLRMKPSCTCSALLLCRQSHLNEASRGGWRFHRLDRLIRTVRPTASRADLEAHPLPPALQTSTSTGGGWPRKRCGLAVKPYAPDWNTTTKSPSTALARSIFSANRSSGVHSGPTTEASSRSVPRTRLPITTG